MRRCDSDHFLKLQTWTWLPPERADMDMTTSWNYRHGPRWSQTKKTFIRKHTCGKFCSMQIWHRRWIVGMTAPVLGSNPAARPLHVILQQSRRRPRTWVFQIHKAKSRIRFSPAGESKLGKCWPTELEPGPTTSSCMGDSQWCTACSRMVCGNH